MIEQIQLLSSKVEELQKFSSKPSPQNFYKSSTFKRSKINTSSDVLKVGYSDNESNLNFYSMGSSLLREFTLDHQFSSTVVKLHDLCSKSVGTQTTLVIDSKTPHVNIGIQTMDSSGNITLIVPYISEKDTQVVLLSRVTFE